MFKSSFKIGDRVRLLHEALRDREEGSWADLKYGILVRQNPTGFGVGCENPGADKTKSWSVRWEGYDYKLASHPNNAHTVNECVIALDEPDENEMNDVLASISQAARNTMSTGGSH